MSIGWDNGLKWVGEHVYRKLNQSRERCKNFRHQCKAQ